ncbi:DUF4386 domain-containing protein [Mucilaginibacter sp. UR6-11]|uniref:DUF4386 domain-containing protein n=1 Tax=Mucilaginibacter sp. UR6-11 TaxID=1435644 RepID=UPI001E4BC8EA|nr:DUF4386 domain-containing protein [Mucilaginibacter sp. UR6-11]MCC8426714.1 DUF4386 domain-containing protein [Mucilaginibacter sp. UR6-11]
MKSIFKSSASPHARITGFIYLFYFITAVLGALLVKNKLVIFGYIVNGVSIACYIIVTVLFYYLFKPVNKYLSLFAALLSLLGCALTAFSIFHLAIAPMINPLLFFGPYCILLGYLIFRSNFLPHFLGVLLIFAGIGWLIILTPLANYLSLYIKLLGILAEASLMLWLIIKGVDNKRWNA